MKRGLISSKLLQLGVFAALVLMPAITQAETSLNRLTSEEIDNGWLLLFDGDTTFGWTATPGPNWEIKDGVLSANSGSDKGLIYTNVEFADYELKVDFRATEATNSGIFLRTTPVPKSLTKDCYELNIADPAKNSFPTGSFVARQKADITAPPAHDQWHTFEVKALKGDFTVKLDGQTVLTYSDNDPKLRGHIGLQYNTGPIEFRNVKLKPLGLESLFNGQDLTGWQVFPDRKSVYSVTDSGELNVKDGPGQLESEAKFGDFVLQLQVFSNGQHLNSGIFFRSIPGDFSNGYESQIQNAYLNDDRTQPADFGTGAIYRRVKARKVVSNDFEWFNKTVIATGRNIATWVNGYQVVDWVDDRKPDENPRRGYRNAPGTLIIQGHDPTTDLSFKNLRAVELPSAPATAD